MKNIVRFATGKLRRRKEKPKTTSCNLCGRAFKLQSRFQRFCHECKQTHELYRFANWFRGGVCA